MKGNELKIILAGLSIAGLVAGCATGGGAPVSHPTPGSTPIILSPSG